MGNAKRRKDIGIYPSQSSDREKLLNGIDRHVKFILKSIGMAQELDLNNPLFLQITNDIPGSINEESIGLSDRQIQELTQWLNVNSKRIGKICVGVLNQQDCPNGGLLHLLDDGGIDLINVIFDNTLSS